MKFLSLQRENTLMEEFSIINLSYIDRKTFNKIIKDDELIYGSYSIEVGEILVVFYKHFLIGAYFTKDMEEVFRNFTKNTKFTKNHKHIKKYINKKNFLLVGTPFQHKVWSFLTTIPKGKVISYKDVAIGINHPKSTRAVGNSISKNPISYFIPCHRVINSNRKIGGYMWGKVLKKKLLFLEGVKILQ